MQDVSASTPICEFGEKDLNGSGALRDLAAHVLLFAWLIVLFAM